MSDTKVEVAFELTVGDTPYFRLNDPVKGVLDNTEYRLAGPIWIDITSKVASVGIKRGKNRELERYSSGSANVVLHNEDRTFDPLNGSSPYAGNIIPRRAIRISTSGYTQFTGVIEDWNLDYDVSGKSNASIVASDAFSLLAQQSLTAGTGVPESTGERIERVLNMPTVAWPLTQRRIDTGSAEVGDDVFDAGENALSYLQAVEASEQGQLFIDRNGYVRFVNGAVTPTTQGSWVLSATNLVTNPSMEEASGTVTVRTNLVTNPSLNTNVTGWNLLAGITGSTLTSVSISDLTGFSKAGQLYLPATSGSGGRASGIVSGLTVGTAYTASVWVKRPDEPFLVQLATSTNGGAGSFELSPSGTNGSWTRYSVSFTAAQTSYYFEFRKVGAVVTSANLFFTGVLLETGSALGNYFDGSTSAAGDFTYAWSGTAHASTSLQRGTGVANITTVGGQNLAFQTNNSFQGAKAARYFLLTTAALAIPPQNLNLTTGTTYTMFMRVRANNRNQTVTPRIKNATSSPVSLIQGVWTDIRMTVAAGSGTDTQTGLLLANASGHQYGDTIDVDTVLIVEGNYTGNYFDGSTPTTFTKRYGWNGTANASTSYEETADVIAYPAFSDAGDGIPYVSATVSYGTELLYNQVTVSAPGFTSTQSNVISQVQYGITTTDVATLLSSANAVESLALFWVAKYGEPEYRFQDLVVSLDGIDGDLAEQVLQIEMGDIVQIKFTPNGIGDSIQRYGQVNKIEHNIGVDRHTITFGFGSLQFSFLVLDDTGFGILDENVLAF